MEHMNTENLMLEENVFQRDTIETRLKNGGFNSLSKFELFIWDLEMFLQLQDILGDKIVLKGGAAAQFYIPVENQRTSIDIDMLCTASTDEVHSALEKIEERLAEKNDYFKFKHYKPKNPKVGLAELETYFVAVPSICSSKELFATNGRQEVKVEFLFTNHPIQTNHVQSPELFALETVKIFNVLTLENLFADKLTTLGPNTIGIPEERADEQFKQLYDVVTLFLSNIDLILTNSGNIAASYAIVAALECLIHGIEYEKENLLQDMMGFLKKIQRIESDTALLQRANDFQALYLRNVVNRDKSEWAIVGFQLELLVEKIFNEDNRISQIKEIDKLIDLLKFEHLRGPEKGRINSEIRVALETGFGHITGLTENLFRKRIERIIWELVTNVTIEELYTAVEEIIKINNSAS